MRLDRLPPYHTASYVMPRWKTVYVSVPKAACTSMKWLVADLQDEDPESFYRSMSRELTRALTIHRRKIWKNTPTLKEITEDELEEISAENGWFIFAVVRQPLSRFWSAWQSKLLMQEPSWVKYYGDAEWFPHDVQTSEDVVQAFQTFASAMQADPTQLIMRDRHFSPQTRLLRPQTVPYSRIYRTDEIPEMLKDLTAHVRVTGYDGPDLTLASSNETPLPLLESAVTPEVLGAVNDLFAADFENFGFSTTPRVAPAGYDTYPDSALAEVHRLVERSERIADLSAIAKQGWKTAREAKAVASSVPSYVALPTRAKRYVRRKLRRT